MKSLFQPTIVPDNPAEVIQDLRNTNQIQFVTISYLQSENEKLHEKVRHLESLLTHLVDKHSEIVLIKK